MEVTSYIVTDLGTGHVHCSEAFILLLKIANNEIVQFLNSNKTTLLRSLDSHPYMNTNNTTVASFRRKG